MTYKTMAKYTFFASILTFLVSFCTGGEPITSFVGYGLLLLAIVFWLVQGKYKMGYQFALFLFLVAALQYWNTSVNKAFPLIAIGISVVAAALQTIEFLFKNKKLL